MKRRYSEPLPAAIDAGHWTIREDSAARVQLNQRLMYVPMADHPQAAAIRAHELSHVAFTPKRFSKKMIAGIEEMTLQSCEDYRVNTLGRNAGVTSLDSGTPEHMIASCLAFAELHGRPKRYVQLALACFTEDEIEQVLAASDKLFADPKTEENPVRTVYGEAIYKFCTDKRPLSFAATCRVARYIDAALPDRGNNYNRDAETDKREEKLARGVLNPAWGDCTLERPKLTLPKKTRGVRVADSGSVLKAPWRVTSDMRVFRACLKAPRRGTVLIDASGSMHLRTEDIVRIARDIPAGTVAAYCGRDESGVIRILAHRGKLASAEDCNLSYGGNVVDGPALQWLGAQQTPRLWVCDGQVTGKFDSTYDVLTREAEKLRARYGIKRIPSLALLTRTALRGRS